ncbi:MAG: hypothetical protein AAGA65_10305 [Actinomycetota bacterium]
MLEAGYRHKEWRRWNRFDWSAVLLDHYFRRTDDRDGPVRVLVATEEELAEAAADPEARPLEVADSLTQVVLTAAGDDDYWKHAAKTTSEPTYFAHLVVACRAAVDLTDIDEDSYIDRLAGLIGTRNTRSLHLMAELWVLLAEWLADHPREYRPLVLPDPRGWTRIGHTTRLAFPSRRDQLRLYRVLADDGLLLESPPVPPVAATIQRNIRQFSARFREEFSTFESGLRDGLPVSELVTSPLWAATEAVVGLSLDDEGQTARQRWTLLGEDSVFDVDLRVATTHPMGLSGSPVREESWNPAPWSYELDGSDPLRDILTGRIGGAGTLSNLAHSGVVPLVQAPHQELELASRSEFGEARCVLVRDDLAADFLREFGGAIGDLGVPGWVVVRDCTIRFVRPDDVSDSALATCWALHESVFPPSIRFIGGITVDGGYLLQPDHLPAIRADNATSAMAEIDGRIFDLTLKDGLFLLPAQLPTSRESTHLAVLVEFPSETRSKSVTLVAAPTSERYKAPADASRWLCEGSGQSKPLDQELGTTPANEPEVIMDADPTVYLGHIVGTAEDRRSDAAWEVIEFGEHVVGRAVGARPGVLPQSRSQDGGACRRWRRLLQASSFSDPQEARLSREWVTAKGLQRVEPVKSLGPVVALPATSTQQLCGMVETVSALSNRRTGVTTKQFLELCELLLGIRPPRAWPVLRSWIESGSLCESIDRRWSNRRLLARQPRLVVFRTQRWFAARLSGLALESTLEFLERGAAERGILASHQRSELGLTPESLAFRSDSLESIVDLAKLAGVGLSGFDAPPWSTGGGPDGRPVPPSNYEPVGHAITSEEWPGISLRRWARRDAPRYWVANTDSGAAWAYHRDTALLLGFALSGAPVVERIGARFDSAGAHLPMGAARMLNLVAPVLSGPSKEGGYGYYCPNSSYADAFEKALDDFVSDVRAALTR